MVDVTRDPPEPGLDGQRKDTADAAGRGSVPFPGSRGDQSRRASSCLWATVEVSASGPGRGATAAAITARAGSERAARDDVTSSGGLVAGRLSRGSNRPVAGELAQRRLGANRAPSVALLYCAGVTGSGGGRDPSRGDGFPGRSAVACADGRIGQAGVLIGTGRRGARLVPASRARTASRLDGVSTQPPPSPYSSTRASTPSPSTHAAAVSGGGGGGTSDTAEWMFSNPSDYPSRGTNATIRKAPKWRSHPSSPRNSSTRSKPPPGAASPSTPWPIASPQAVRSRAEGRAADVVDPERSECLARWPAGIGVIFKTQRGRWRVQVKYKSVVVADRTFDRKGESSDSSVTSQ